MLVRVRSLSHQQTLIDTRGEPLTLIQNIALETLRTLFLASPFLLFGLLAAGFLHVLLPTSVIQRWMGRRGLSGVTMAAAIGVPLPVCSCGVVPISVELRRKGASEPASLSFLTTTPESSIDSIFFTWALMGPVMAIARPIAAFFTALLGGVLAIAYLPADGPPPAGTAPEDAEPEEEPPAACGCGPEDDGGDGDDGDDRGPNDDDCDDCEALGYDRAPEALAAVRAWWRRLGKRGGAEGPGLWRTVVRPALSYGFGELLDDLAFWLLLGVLLAGVLGAVLPADLAARGLGSGLLPMLVMLAVGVPLYMCASASTPIAAALFAKGISPGAALVFLLAGPATNAATLVLLGRTFGRRFIQIYLASVVAGALVAGLALDFLVAALGWRVTTPLVDPAASAGFGAVEWLSFLLLAVLLAASLWRGAGRRGWRELVSGFAGLLPAEAAGRRRARRRVAALAAGSVIGLYFLAGLSTVPPDSLGYRFRFDSLVARDLPPGLHFVWTPVERLEVQPTRLARKSDIGFKTDLRLLERRRELVRVADPDEWHSTVTAMNMNPEQATYLTADENLVEMSFTIHYGLDDPAAFFYSLDHQNDLVALYAEAAARQFLAQNPLEELLTVRREEIEEGIRAILDARLRQVGSGIAVSAVRVVDIHPPSGAVFAFRDVSSAREDRETRIHRSRELQARELPRARGEAELVTARARSAAAAAVTEADGRSRAFVAEAAAAADDKNLVEHLLRLEAAERLFAGRELYVVPPGAAGPNVSVWRDQPQDRPQRENR